MNTHTQREQICKCEHVCARAHTHVHKQLGSYKKVFLPLGRGEARKGELEDVIAELSLTIWTEYGQVLARQDRGKDVQAMKECEKRHEATFTHSTNICEMPPMCLAHF